MATATNCSVEQLKLNGYIKLPNTDILHPQLDAIYSAIILGSSLVKEAKGKKSFTTYRIRVIENDDSSWNTLRRYSEFYSLKQNIKSNFTYDIKHKFPPKKLRGNMTPELIDLRHQQLQSWFKEVLIHPKIGHSKFVKSFLSELKLEIDEEDIVRVDSGEVYIKPDLGKMGYLYKLRKGKFKKIWCVLRNNILYKYKTHLDKHPYDQDVFISCTVTEVEFQEPDEFDLFCFMILTDKDKLIFGTDTEQDTEEWVDCLAAATYPLEDE